MTSWTLLAWVAEVYVRSWANPFCSALVGSEPTWLNPNELKLEAEKYFCCINHIHHIQSFHAFKTALNVCNACHLNEISLNICSQFCIVQLNGVLFVRFYFWSYFRMLAVDCVLDFIYLFIYVVFRAGQSNSSMPVYLSLVSLISGSCSDVVCSLMTCDVVPELAYYLGKGYVQVCPDVIAVNCRPPPQKKKKKIFHWMTKCARNRNWTSGSGVCG